MAVPDDLSDFEMTLEEGREGEELRSDAFCFSSPSSYVGHGDRYIRVETSILMLRTSNEEKSTQKKCRSREKEKRSVSFTLFELQFVCNLCSPSTTIIDVFELHQTQR